MKVFVATEPIGDDRDFCKFNRSSSQVSRRLTSLVPQPRHRTVLGRRFPWSQHFDHIFRNEEVTGSNPVSSTDFTLY
jgi:hypothetical protein